MIEDGESCWPGLDLIVPLTLNNDKISETRDDKYLYNMSKLEDLFTPKMFKSSFLGTWTVKEP